MSRTIAWKAIIVSKRETRSKRMKITINGAGVTPEAVSLILADLEKEYGLKVRDLTMYVRFADKNGKVVEPKLPGMGETELVMTVKESAKPEEPPESISIEKMRELIEHAQKRKLVKKELELLVYLYDLKIDKATFLKAFYLTIEHCSNFSMCYFEKAVIALMEKENKE